MLLTDLRFPGIVGHVAIVKSKVFDSDQPALPTHAKICERLRVLEGLLRSV